MTNWRWIGRWATSQRPAYVVDGLTIAGVILAVGWRMGVGLASVAGPAAVILFRSFVWREALVWLTEMFVFAQKMLKLF